MINCLIVGLNRLYSWDSRRWLTNFFGDRTHQTRVGIGCQYLSAVAKLLSGVVHGSGIARTRFVSHIH